MARQTLPSVFPSNAFQSPFFRSLHDEIDRKHPARTAAMRP